MKTFKQIVGAAFIIGAVVTFILYYFTNKMNFVGASWIPWVLFFVGGLFFASVFNQEEKEQHAEAESKMSKSEKDNLNLLRNLYAVASSDKKMKAEENAYIQLVMQDYGMESSETVKQMNYILNHGNTATYIPSSDEEKTQHFGLLMQMLMIDGTPTESEKKTIRNIIKKWGWEEVDLDSCIETIAQDDDFQKMRAKVKEAAKMSKFKDVKL